MNGNSKGDQISRIVADYTDQNDVMNRIYAGAGKYILGLPRIRGAFKSCNWIVSCMDEGTPQGDIRLPGSGTLLEYKIMLRMLLRATEDALLEGKELVITSHYNCIAGAALAQDLGRPVAEGDKIAMKITKERAARAGVKHVHLDAEKLERPLDRHISRIVYVDGVGNFSPRKVEGLPPGFCLSKKYIPNNIDLAEYVGIALSTASDEKHGFGDLISEDEPLVVIPIAKTRRTLAKTIDTLAPTVKEFNKRLGGEKIIIDGVVVECETDMLRRLYTF